jgi:phosphatidylethanolamine/phosphatidyl-N-methylethanolamine N-methyltransferase
MPEDAKLLSIDINPRFHSYLRSIADNRLIAHLGNACRLKEILALYRLGSPEAIVSGIPFFNMDYRTGSQVCEAISTLLAPNGRFVAYQVSSRVASLIQPFLGTEQVAVEFLNVPPMRVYQWEKKGA